MRIGRELLPPFPALKLKSATAQDIGSWKEMKEDSKTERDNVKRSGVIRALPNKNSISKSISKKHFSYRYRLM